MDQREIFLFHLDIIPLMTSVTLFKFKWLSMAIIYVAKAKSPIRTRIGMQIKKRIDNNIGSGLKEIKMSHKTSHKNMNSISMDKRSKIEQALKNAFK